MATATEGLEQVVDKVARHVAGFAGIKVAWKEASKTMEKYVEDMKTASTWTTADGDLSWCHSSLGNQVHCLDLRDDEIEIEDIASGLLKPRFNGWTTRWYSVAEHSVRGSWMLPDDQALDYLLHDGGEAYTGDIQRPNKSHSAYAQLVAIEAANLAKILAFFGRPTTLPDYVHEVDARMLATEKRDLLRPGKAKWTCPAKPYDWRIQPWLPDEARGQFLLRFRQLTGTLLDTGREPRRSFGRGGRS